jgi:methionine-rich copper-binding protein CopC
VPDPLPTLPRRAVGVVTLAALAASLLPRRAAAHAILEDSQPPARGSVPAGAVAFRLRFNSRIDRPRSRLTLIRPDKSRGDLPIAPNDAPDVLTTQATLTPGAYVLRWQVLAIDGHITRGDIPFTVTGA